jgi:type II secretory pathway pseudopilin PulG
MNQKGHTLLLIMLVLAAFLAAGLLFTQQVQTRIDGRQAEEVRLQALWLARSATDAGVTGSRRVQTPLGTATVTITGGTVEVALAGGRATVTGLPRTERYEPPARPE